MNKMHFCNKFLVVPLIAVGFLCFTQSSASLYELELGEPLQILPLNDSTSCGGRLTGSSGSISYKASETLSPNERCIWLIRPGVNTSSFTIGVFNLGTPGGDHQLTISGLEIYSNISHLVPESSGLYTITNTSVLIVTLHAGANVTRDIQGFSLQYTAHDEGHVDRPSIYSRDTFIAPTRGHLWYPSGGYNYTNNELTTFIFVPANNVYNSGERVDITIVVNQLESLCLDRLVLYSFNPGSNNPWKQVKVLCHRLDRYAVSTNDLLLAVFETDKSNVYSGFEMFYNTCSAS